MIRGYDAWKLATPYDGECPECGSNRFNEECETCVAAMDYAEAGAGLTPGSARPGLEHRRPK